MVWGAEGYQEPLLGPPELFTPIACSGGQKGVLGGRQQAPGLHYGPLCPQGCLRLTPLLFAQSRGHSSSRGGRVGPPCPGQAGAGITVQPYLGRVPLLSPINRE